MMKKDARLIENIRQKLDQSLDDLDPATSFKLAQARHQALAARPQRKPWLLVWGPLPAAGMLLLALLFYWSSPNQPPTAPELGDLGIFTAAEPLEFYQEDIEFYEWLSEVLETEKEFSEHVLPRTAPVADNCFGTGGHRFATAESGTARLPGVI